MILCGRIIEEQKSYYQISTEVGIIRSTLKGVLKKKKKRLYVGDFVRIEIFNSDIPEGIIRELLPRKNRLTKPAVSNIDQVLLLITYKEPVMDIHFINKFLFLSNVLNLPTIIVFNKNDLLVESDITALKKIMARYKDIGYICFSTSAFTGENIDALMALCRNKCSIFAGPSGTGKSTVLSKIFPDKTFRTKKLSKHIQRGIHTTTHTTLLKLKDTGYIADTPGFSFVDLPIMDEQKVITYFPDIASEQGKCKFADCIHDNEPGCYVKTKVSHGYIDEYRYQCYLNIFHFMKEKRKKY
ncbi:MAG: ribosome small subunit-dependent GTPase A [Chitinispirillia bacterium]|jgi:ribosome biogenesis GTPase